MIIMEKWQNYKIPTASKLFWMIIYETEVSDEVYLRKSNINLSIHFISSQYQFQLVKLLI